MRIGVDARLVAKGRGLGEFAYQLISHFPQNTENHFFIYTYRQADWNKSLLPTNTTIRIVPSSYVISEQLVLPWLIRQDRLDVFHATTNTAPLLLPRELKLVLTIHDAMFLTDKQRIPVSSSMYQRWGRKYYSLMAKWMVKRANRVVTISEFSKSDLAGALKLKPKDLWVIYEGVGEEFRPAPPKEVGRIKQELQINGDYLLHLGAVDKRKQTAYVIESFCRYTKSNNSKAAVLVITGLKGEEIQPFRQQVKDLNLSNQVIFAGFVSKKQLIGLYSGATLFLFPSLYEGFGLPMLQAMACGCPVITSNNTSLPEIGGEAVHYIDLDDNNSLTEAINYLLSSKKDRVRLSQLGFKHTEMYDWQLTSKKYLDLYEEL